MKIFKRLLIIFPALLLQVFWIRLLFTWLSNYSIYINILLSLTSFLLVIYIISKREEGAYKQLWLLVLLISPLIGSGLYLYFGNKRTGRWLQKSLDKNKINIYVNNDDLISDIKDKRIANIFTYISKFTGYEISKNNKLTYYALGEDMFKDMLVDLKNAKDFVYIEYFIIENGHMWSSIVDILKDKVKEGVDVRLIFDDVGSLNTYSKRELKYLRSLGIKCIDFNPLIFVSGTLNYRDHRKMLIIDNKIAYSGGVNIADEYINVKEKYGHWKDIGFRVIGEGVNNFTKMFIEFYNVSSKQKLAFDYNFDTSTKANGYMISFYESPLDGEPINNNLYIEMLSNAKNYIYFYTPYLMLSDTLLDAFVRASQKGIDVRIIMPGIPDKKTVFRLSRSYYNILLEAGVKIYEYSQGFVHAKACICDGELATIGTVNLDYRSLYLHFENNSIFYQCDIIKTLEEDFLETQEKSAQIYKSSLSRRPLKKLIDGILRIFAPLC